MIFAALRIIAIISYVLLIALAWFFDPSIRYCDGNQIKAGAGDMTGDNEREIATEWFAALVHAIGEGGEEELADDSALFSKTKRAA